MMVKVLSPGMQHRQKADAGAQVSWVGADPQKSLVPGGGIASDHSRGISCRRQFLFPVKVLSRLFRAKFVADLKAAFRHGELNFYGELKSLAEKRNFLQWLKRMVGTEWVVYAKPPFGEPRQVLTYLARHAIGAGSH